MFRSTVRLSGLFTNLAIGVYKTKSSRTNPVVLLIKIVRGTRRSSSRSKSFDMIFETQGVLTVEEEDLQSLDLLCD